MREAHWHIHLPPGLSRELCRNKLAICGGIASHINCNVKNSSPQDSYKFGLCHWRNLEMHPAERTGVFGVGLVLLDIAARNTNIAQPHFTESFAKPTTVVEVPFWCDNLWQV